MPVVALSDVIGHRIVRVRRLLYAFKGELSDVGPLEVTLDIGPILFWPGPDGEALRVTFEEWADPFGTADDADNADNADNRAFIAKSGKLEALDVTQQQPFSRLVGQPLEAVTAQHLPEGKLVGLTFHTASAILRVWVDFDEIEVEVTTTDDGRSPSPNRPR